MKKLLCIISLIAVVIICIFIFKYMTYNNSKNNSIYDQKIDSLSKEIINRNIKINKLRVKYDSLQNIIIKLEIYLNQKSKDEKIINEKYEKIKSNLRNLGINDHIVFFTSYLSKEDSIRKRHMYSDSTATTEGLQFFIR